ITSDFPILQVAFQRLTAGPSRGWTTVATSSTEPFDVQFDTTSVPDGLYSLPVVATEPDGATIYSPPLVGPRVDNTPPAANLANPGSPLTGRVTLAASASDGQGSGVANVRFERSVAGADTWVLIAADDVAPYSIRLDTSTLPNGAYDFRAVARDRAGNSAPSPVVAAVSVDNAAKPP